MAAWWLRVDFSCLPATTVGPVVSCVVPTGLSRGLAVLFSAATGATDLATSPVAVRATSLAAVGGIRASVIAFLA